MLKICEEPASSNEGAQACLRYMNNHNRQMMGRV